MYSKTIIPTKENHTIDLPEEFFGKKILITVEAFDTEIKPPSEEKLAEIEKTFAKYKKVNLDTFNFNRDEANNFDE